MALNLSRREQATYVPQNGQGIPHECNPHRINYLIRYLREGKIAQTTLENKIKELEGTMSRGYQVFDMVQERHQEMVRRIIDKLERKDW